MEALLDYGADPDAKEDAFGRSPLHVLAHEWSAPGACGEGDQVLQAGAALLVSRGADVELKDDAKRETAYETAEGKSASTATVAAFGGAAAPAPAPASSGGGGSGGSGGPAPAGSKTDDEGAPIGIIVGAVIAVVVLIGGAMVFMRMRSKPSPSKSGVYTPAGDSGRSSDTGKGQEHTVNAGGGPAPMIIMAPVGSPKG